MDAPPSLTPDNPSPQYPPQAPTPAAPGTKNPSTHAENRTLMAVLAYLGILVLVPLLSPARHNPFVRFHIQQGLVLLVAEVATAMLASVLLFLWFVFPVIWFATIVYIFIGVANAAQGKTAPLPLIGQFGERFQV